MLNGSDFDNLKRIVTELLKEDMLIILVKNRVLKIKEALGKRGRAIHMAGSLEEIPGWDGTGDLQRTRRRKAVDREGWQL